MNKVFKVIWSEARNAYVVVSEIAKNHGSKSCSTKKLLAMLIATDRKSTRLNSSH